VLPAYHCTAGVGVPEAVTVKVTGLPVVTFCEGDSEVITGGIADSVVNEKLKFAAMLFPPPSVTPVATTVTVCSVPYANAAVGVSTTELTFVAGNPETATGLPPALTVIAPGVRLTGPLNVTVMVDPTGIAVAELAGNVDTTVGVAIADAKR
jgi:hypothetical protein